MNIKRDNLGGALLFTIVTSLVISLTSATIVAIMLNHSLQTEYENKRKEAFQLVRAGYEYVYSLLGNGDTVPSSVTINGHELQITLTRLAPRDISDYSIEVSTEY